MAATTPKTSAKGLARPAAEFAFPGARVPLALALPVALPEADDVVVVVADNVGDTKVVLRGRTLPVPVSEATGGRVVVTMDELSATETDETMAEIRDDADETTDETDEAEAEADEADKEDEADEEADDKAEESAEDAEETIDADAEGEMAPETDN